MIRSRIRPRILAGIGQGEDSPRAPEGYGLLVLNGKYLTLNGKYLILQTA